MNPLNGVLPIDKPIGPTSHDAVAVARRALSVRRIGHTGTLDPFASGLLLLCIGPSTRLAEYLTALPKRYSATLRLGVTTDTDDHLGSVLRSSEAWRSVTAAAAEDALAEQSGELMQVPPRYSAKKVAGERMYAAARRGEEVKAKPVRVHVSRIEMRQFDPPNLDFEVDCSSGTYIRAIARDVGERLGTGGHLVRLRRARIGPFDVQTAVPLESLADANRVSAALLTPAEAVADFPSVVVRGDELDSVVHGRPLESPEGLPSERPIALLSAAGELIAIGERAGDLLRPRKVFA